MDVEERRGEEELQGALRSQRTPRARAVPLLFFCSCSRAMEKMMRAHEDCFAPMSEVKNLLEGKYYRVLNTREFKNIMVCPGEMRRLHC